MSLLHDASHAWRALRRAPGFSLSVVVTLTVGLGAATATFAVVNGVLIRPLPYGNPDRLVSASFDIPSLSFSHAGQTPATYRAFKQFAHTIDDIALYRDGTQNVTDPAGLADPERMSVGWMTANAIPLLDVAPILGRSFGADEDAPKGPAAVIISEGLWRSRFGANRNVIGTTLMISGRPTRVIGVMPAAFRFPSASTQLWLPLQLDPNALYPGGFNYDAVARLRPGVSIDAARREFAAVLPRAPELSPNMAPGVSLRTVLDQAKPIPRLVPMRDDVVGDVARSLWMVAATAGLLFLVTCANVASLLLVRADGRQHELSLRAVLGASRSRVLAHFFTESALLAAVSMLAGLGVASVGVHALVSAGPSQLPRLAEVRVDAAAVAFAAVAGLLAALACGAIPAVRFLRADPAAGLREGGGRWGTASDHRQRARATLVAAQVAFALVVLAVSALLLRSVERLRAVRPGFDANGVATLWLSLPAERYATDTAVVQFYARLMRQVSALPGVTAAGLASHIPLTSHGTDVDPVFVEGAETIDQKIPPLELYVTADSGYFRAMGIPIVAGRGFAPFERQRPDEALISRETARVLFHDSTGRAAVGKRFRELPGGAWRTVVGVVGDVRDTSLAVPPMRMVYYPEAANGDTVDDQLARTVALVARTTGDVAATTRAMQRLVHDADATLPTFDVRSMQDAVAGSIARLTFTMIVLSVAAAATLLLSVVGLYGVIAYIVTLRTRELGVRIALGAEPRDVAMMVTRQGVALCATGMVAGLALVAVAGRFVRAFLFEVAPSDPLALGAAAALLTTCALLASWIPARRAARVNPVEALRAE